MSSASAPTIVSGYRLDRKLAVGGSGTVHAATRLSDGEPVAFKLMHAELEEMDSERHRFSREAEIVRRLVHPYVVRLLDYGQSERNVPFLVFPLLAGRTLQEHLQEHGRFSMEECGRLSLQVLSALEAAHRVEIAHRDIKPANLFLVGGAARVDVRILDFGLAKLLRGTKRVDITKTGALIGTPRYMAPEQVRGEKIGMAADIYSFGLVMGEMMLGRPVVRAKRELELYMAHGSDRPLDIPREILESPFAPVIRRALAKPLEVRYQSASQMHADVGAVVAALARGGQAPVPAPDLESTMVIHKSELEALRKRKKSKASKRLRDAFNMLAERAAADEDNLPEMAIPEPAKTIPMDLDIDEEPLYPNVPTPLESMPILLTRKPADHVEDLEADTQRLRPVRLDDD